MKPAEMEIVERVKDVEIVPRIAEHVLRIFVVIAFAPQMLEKIAPPVPMIVALV